jgi:hypothetical protein
VPTSSDTRGFEREGAELPDHRVDGRLERSHLAFDLDRDLLRQVALRDRCPDHGDRPHLVRQARTHTIDL